MVFFSYFFLHYGPADIFFSQLLGHQIIYSLLHLFISTIYILKAIIYFNSCQVQIIYFTIFWPEIIYFNTHTPGIK